MTYAQILDAAEHTQSAFGGASRYHGPTDKQGQMNPQGRAGQFVRHFKRDSLICLEGDEGELILQIKEGKARAYRTSIDGCRQIVAFLYPGDIFRVSYEAQCHYTVEALTASQVRLYSWQGLLRLMKSDEALFETIFNDGMKSTLEGHRHLVIMGQRCAMQRVCTFLLGLHDRFADDGRAIVLTLPTQRDIADYLGLTSETVCRQLKALKARKIIKSINRRDFTISDVRTLREMAGESDCFNA